MAETITNVVVDTKHNTWTLMKHVAGSINKAAAKTDKTIYGNQVHIEIREKTFAEKHPNWSAVGTVAGGLLIGVLMFIVFIGLITGNIRGRDLISF